MEVPVTVLENPLPASKTSGKEPMPRNLCLRFLGEVESSIFTYPSFVMNILQYDGQPFEVYSETTQDQNLECSNSSDGKTIRIEII